MENKIAFNAKLNSVSWLGRVREGILEKTSLEIGRKGSLSGILAESDIPIGQEGQRDR